MPKCSSPISHNVIFRTATCTFLFRIEHCWIINRCLWGFEKLVYFNGLCIVYILLFWLTILIISHVFFCKCLILLYRPFTITTSYIGEERTKHITILHFSIIILKFRLGNWPLILESLWILSLFFRKEI